MKGGDRWGEVWSASLGGVGQWPRRLREQGREIAPCWGHGGDDDDEDGDDGDGDNDDDGYDDNVDGDGDETRGERVHLPKHLSFLLILCLTLLSFPSQVVVEDDTLVQVVKALTSVVQVRKKVWHMCSSKYL